MKMRLKRYTERERKRREDGRACGVARVEIVQEEDVLHLGGGDVLHLPFLNTRQNYPTGFMKM
jgi:hypothetical protein